MQIFTDKMQQSFIAVFLGVALHIVNTFFFGRIFFEAAISGTYKTVFHEPFAYRRLVNDYTYHFTEDLSFLANPAPDKF